MSMFISGVGASVVATGIGWIVTWFYQQNQSKKMYKKMDGHYNEFIIGVEGKPFEEKKEPTASVQIKYLKKNLLFIKVEEVYSSNLLWKGEISMQSANVGIVSWYYPEMFKENEHSFGTKCLICPEEKANMIYLTNDSVGNPSAVLKSITFEELCEQRKNKKINN